MTDYAGVTGGAAFGQPEWALNGSVNYARGRYSVSVQARYIDSGIYDVRYIEPGQPGYSSASPFSVNDNTVDSALYTTLSGRYELPQGNRNMNLELFATINNALNEKPPLSPSGSYPFNTSFFDQIGRSFRVGLRGDF